MNIINNKENRIQGLNLVRLMCCFGVIAYHFSVHASIGKNLFLTNANSAWGGIMVDIFFMISGGLLYFNHSDINKNNILQYYKKRFLSIYPAFYIAYAFMFMSNIFSNHCVFWSGDPKFLILSLLGLDGYLHNIFLGDYYILGEWFLGALILLYFIFPLLVKLINKFNFYFLIFCLIFYYFSFKLNNLFLMNEANFISCTTTFIIGIYMFKYKDYIFNRKLFIPAVIIFLITTFKFFSVPSDIITKVTAFSLLIVIQVIGTFIDTTRLYQPIRWLSSITYEAFLIQHLVIVRVLSVKDYKTLIPSILLLVITTVLVFIYAKGLSVLAKELRKYISSVFDYFTGKFSKNSSNSY